MPLFEYACRDCGHRFEFLTREGRTARCPQCAGIELDKQLSVFAVSAGSSPARMAPAPRACGMCGDRRGPGSCSTS
jgi:putative FmdB family regulatory protein